MSDNELDETIESVRKKQENISVGIGVFFTLTLCTYFFTYARLVDVMNVGGLWFMGISTILMLVILFKLQKCAFFLVRLWLGNKPAFRDAIAKLSDEMAS